MASPGIRNVPKSRSNRPVPPRSRVGAWHSRSCSDLSCPTRGRPGNRRLPGLRCLASDRGADHDVTNRLDVFDRFGSSQRPNISCWNAMPAPFSTPRSPCVGLGPVRSLVTADDGVNARGTQERRIRQLGQCHVDKVAKWEEVIDPGHPGRLPLQCAAVRLHARLSSTSRASLPGRRSAGDRHPALPAGQHGLR